MRRIMAYLWQLESARNLSQQSGMKFASRDLRREIAHLPHGNMPGADAAKRFNLTLARSLHAAATLLERVGALATGDVVKTAGTAFGFSGTWLARRDPILVEIGT